MHKASIPIDEWRDLPGAEMVCRGLADLRCGRESIDALLVVIAYPRFTRLGAVIPATLLTPFVPDTELRLYRLLCRQQPRDPYSLYNALLRQLASYGRALEHRARWYRDGEGAEKTP